MMINLNFPKKEPLLKIGLVKELVKDEFETKKEYTNRLIDLEENTIFTPKSQMLLVYNKYCGSISHNK